MIGAFNWPDLVIVFVIGFTTYKGYRRGFISELGGLIAIIAGFVAPRFYNGFADALIDHYTKLGPPISHGIGVLGSGVAAYLIVLAIVFILNRIAKLPVLGMGNAVAGGTLGFLKGTILLWLILFVALFFPLTTEIRDTLHHSILTQYITAVNAPIDDAVQWFVPPLVKPFLAPIFARHHV